MVYCSQSLSRAARHAQLRALALLWTAEGMPARAADSGKRRTLSALLLVAAAASHWHVAATTAGTSGSAAAAGLAVPTAVPTAVHCPGLAAPAAPAGHQAAKPWVSWWFDTHWSSSGNSTAALAQLRRQGGFRVATSMLLYCGDFVTADGAVQAGTEGGSNSSANYCAQPTCCSAMTTQLQDMGIAVERVVTLPVRGDAGGQRGEPLDHLRRMIANPGPAISALVGLAKTHKLRGISFDLECKSTVEDAKLFARFCAKLREALSPLGARLTVYSNVHDAHLSNVSLLADSVDRVLNGDTYNYQSLDCPAGFKPLGDGSVCENVRNSAIKCRLWGTTALPTCAATGGTNFSHWLEHYRNFVCAAPLAKAGVGMKASTGRGTWNCEPPGIAERLRQLQADKIPELAIFSLSESPPAGCDLSSISPECGCSSLWFEAARAFLAQPLRKLGDGIVSAQLAEQPGPGARPRSRVWPKPASSTRTGEGASAPISFANFSIVAGPVDSPDRILGKAAARYRGIILAQTLARAAREAPTARAQAPPYTITLRVEDGNVPLSPGPSMNESYVLDAAAAGCVISAPSVWGALRGLETLSQLVKPSAAGGGFELEGPVVVADGPRFGWRGLMIDTGRHYLTVTTIKMAIDAMSYTKMNLLHWHMVDDQSFAIDSEALPNLAGDGAFSPRHTYSLADLRAVVAYARERGVAVLPELDMPGHASSWTRGYPAIKSRCPPTAGEETTPLDPTANATYELIQTLLAELDPIFPAEFPFWHVGGDEVRYDCWQSSDGGYVDKFMEAHGIAAGDYPGLQGYFEQKVIDMVRALPTKKRTVLWEDNSRGARHGTAGLPKDAVVQLFHEDNGDASVLDATVSGGWQVFYTTRDWYFDHGKTLTDGSWESDYAMDPFANSTLPEATLNSAVLGAESCMWSPHFDSANFMIEAFPRAAAVAERLWSARSVTDVTDARARLHEWRCRLLQRGLATGPVDGGVPSGASGKAPWSPTTTFGGHCEGGPWQPYYSPPF